MKKAIILFAILSLLATCGVAMLMGYAFAVAEDGVVTHEFNQPASGSTDFVHPWVNWDLTRGDLEISYNLDMSAYSPTAGTETSEVGIIDHQNPFGRIGWLESSAPLSDQFPDNFDKNDLLVLQTSRWGDNRYMTYDAVFNAPDDFRSYPWWPWAPWNPWNNCGIWYDRGAADGKPQAGLYGGKMCNTGGRYDVTVRYHALDAKKGVMLATVNGVPTGFYDNYATPYAGEPQFTPAGKTFEGDMTSVQVYARCMGQGVAITNLRATGNPAEPSLIFVSPNAAEQGDRLKGVLLAGENFRPVPSTVQLAPAAGAAINSTAVNWMDKCWVNADINIPESAVAGRYDTRFWHNDDTAAVASLPGSFNISYASPRITTTGGAHCRPGQAVTVNIDGRYFRNTPMTVKLVRGNESVSARSVRWVSSTSIKAEFAIPSGATIACDWDVYVSHDDDGKVAALPGGFSVDARMDIINPFGIFNIIWLRAPGILKVVLYSEGSFDALSIFPLAVDLGGAFPIACNPQDVNRDGKKDQVFYFWNMSVNLPVGYNRWVRMLCADLTLKRVQAWDAVKVFRFLF